jgi:hypothetical protein
MHVVFLWGCIHVCVCACVRVCVCAQDYNTATFPHKKYYDVEKYEMDEYKRKQACVCMRSVCVCVLYACVCACRVCCVHIGGPCSRHWC